VIILFVSLKLFLAREIKNYQKKTQDLPRIRVEEGIAVVVDANIANNTEWNTKC
jgi:hypothetical protein